MAAQKRLGRGLEALLGDRDARSAPATHSNKTLPTASLQPGQYQPRRRIDDDSLAELVQSIQRQGVLQPLVVRKLDVPGSSSDAERYEIVAGERRWRAAKLAGLQTVPVVVRALTDEESLAVALIENLQREDLSAIEIARSLEKLTTEFELTHQQAAEAVGRSRSAVSNYLRLLELDGAAREFLDRGELEMGHARALLTMEDEGQARLARTIMERKLSVREAEALVAEERDGRPAPRTHARPVDLQARWLQRQFASELGVKVVIHDRRDGKALSIAFSDLAELAASLKKIETLVSGVVDTAGPRVVE